MPTPMIQRRWKNLPGEPVGDAGDPYTGYDRFGRTEQMRWIKPHTEGNGFDTLAHVQWGYNRASQKTWRKDLLAPASTGQNQHFGYDGLNQVTERQRGLLNINTTAVGGIPAQQENFSYDETGNWITYKQNNEGALDIDQSRVNNQSNQMTQVDGSSAGVSYDKNGNMLTVPTGDDLTGPSRKLVWDAWNRLTKVTDENDNVIAEYEYDGLSRRTKVTSSGVTKHSYYDDQWRTVEERLDSSTTPVTQHVWHPTDRWELLFRDRSTANDGTLDERLYSLKDQLDPVAICDASGSVVERFAYSAFGVPSFLDSSFIPQPSSLVDWSFLFHAEFADAETGWFNYGYRFYVPALGRWLSRDPIGERGGLNLYGMMSGDPMNRVDMLGLDWAEYVGLTANIYAGEPGNRSKLLKSCPAASGLPYKQSPAKEFQKDKGSDGEGAGPLQEGKYNVDLRPDPTRVAPIDPKTERLRANDDGGISKIPSFTKGGVVYGFPAWGVNRALLEPKKGTETYGRKNQYVHDSKKGYSHGCLECGDLMQHILKVQADKKQKDFEVWVKYADPATGPTPPAKPSVPTPTPP
jgi:RHS repeat-associated protein